MLKTWHLPGSERCNICLRHDISQTMTYTGQTELVCLVIIPYQVQPGCAALISHLNFISGNSEDVKSEHETASVFRLYQGKYEIHIMCDYFQDDINPTVFIQALLDSNLKINHILQKQHFYFYGMNFNIDLLFG